jgi:hypothetical protein
MARAKSTTSEAEKGRFVCLGAHQPLPLKPAQSLRSIHWPMVLKNCPACERKDTVELKDVEHPPVYGYE